MKDDKHDDDSCSRGSQSRLDGAVASRSVAACRLLLEHNVDDAFAVGSGRTALHRAAESGDVDILKVLLDRLCDVNITDGRGFTALHIACGAAASCAGDRACATIDI